MTNHPITPPPDLVEQWRAASSNVPASLSTDPGGRRDYIDFIATQAAQWGADQELEACINYFHEYDTSWGENSELITGLRNARRPQPPSLKEQALKQLDEISNCFRVSHGGPIVCDKIRKALEAL